MHVPQIWSIRRSAEVRRTLRLAFEHRQREDLRVSVVLVYRVKCSQWNPSALQMLCYHVASSKALSLESQVQAGRHGAG